MRPSTKRLLSTILSLIFIFSAFLVFLNLIKPTYNETQNLRAEILINEKNLEDRKSIINQFNSLIKEYEGQLQVQESLSLSLPTNYRLSEALIQISGLLDSNNINLLSFNISKPITNTFIKNDSLLKPVGNFEIAFKILGTYSDFKNFLNQLENNIRLFNIKNININRADLQPGQSTTTKNLFFDVSVLTYYQVAD